MIIAIDGPTASGKSTTAALVAKHLEFLYINSGLLFRSLAYIFSQSTAQGLQSGEDFLKAVDHHLANLHYVYNLTAQAHVFFHEHDITPLLKTPDIDQITSAIAKHHVVRHLVTAWQRRLALGNNVVIEGRDAGLVVFPDAELKIFLTADLQVRAERWRNFQAQKNEILLSQTDAYRQVLERDEQDSTRALSPLKVCPDAIIIDNSSLSVEQTVQSIIQQALSAMPVA